ncbi:MAG: glycosyltransferase [Candidatus Bathyarchaeia archaeon]
MDLVFAKQQNSGVKPKVTIGICVRNCEATLRKTLNSVLNQDFPHELVEVIIVDDGSEDKTLNIALELASKIDMQVKVFSGKWMGIGPARNVVVDNAEGDYIIWVDGDMILPKDHVRKHVDFMERNPKVGIAKARHKVLPEENIVAFLEHVPYLIYDSKPKVLRSKLPGTGGSIYRTSAIKQAKGFDNNLRNAGEDQDAAYRVSKTNWLICQSPAFFYEKRVETWRTLLKKYVWYGYGNHDLYNKNRDIFYLTRMNPLAGFITGVLYASVAYRLTKRKALILLPLHFFLKMSAWFFGFTKARMDYLTRNHTRKSLHISSS